MAAYVEGSVLAKGQNATPQWSAYQARFLPKNAEDLAHRSPCYILSDDYGRELESGEQRVSLVAAFNRDFRKDADPQHSVRSELTRGCNGQTTS
jgi:hypothetical protein